ncbi:HNH endonuclease domain-containing protein [Flavobacterium psychrotrophum]|uniref:HNH endonuclease domain-containing protein n=1 Tax=Flavobacterium psychrotrophum TaxID=2294119 RepID=UPI000E30FD21|nr:HNH endonuclease domain-containing protein [Flavobacterium psychrotrophum]
MVPFHPNLPVKTLSGLFSNTASTYKFYWFLAILEAVETGKTVIEKQELFARMVAGAWYTVNYFHVSFGKQDLLQQSIETIKAGEALPVNLRQEDIVSRLAGSIKTETVKVLWHFDNNVPHWFLSPWFNKTTINNDSSYKKYIYTASAAFEGDCLYALDSHQIIINPKWVGYLTTHSRILKDYCLWNLAAFLQVRNPSVPDIAGKLIKPPFRGSLLPQRKHYWDIVFKELGSIECIYTNTKMDITNYAVDHFIPHAFVSHDLIWNLAPIDKQFNSIKSDKLPSLEKHFEPFVRLQQEAYNVICTKAPKNKYLEEFITIFPKMDASGLNTKLYSEVLIPLHTIAGNNGFILL